ncbi:hypothetical protein [Streptomyces sp. NPDC052114]|uniref:hypothetical protein n=1 Tax=unclassified Streptomyces TaxID=2593676 RepID=UPI0034364A95
MPDPTPDAHVRLTLHPQHPSAVVATLTGSTQHTARATLSSEGFRPIGDGTMLLVRIDHEEPYYANITANLLRDAGIPVDVTAQLQEEIDTEWTWANHPMTWLDRDEIRLVSANAQKIHDDINSGLLTIHLHAHDGHTTVAVGTYQHADSVHLHGEDHLRVVSSSYDTPNGAIADFERLYGDAVRPGPPPPTAHRPPPTAHRPPQRNSKPPKPSAACRRQARPAPLRRQRNRPRRRRSWCRCTQPTPATTRRCWTSSWRNRASGRSTGPSLLSRRVVADLTGWRDEQVACFLGPQARADHPTTGTCSGGMDGPGGARSVNRDPHG